MEPQRARGKRRGALWLLVLLAVVLVWWWWRPPREAHAPAATPNEGALPGEIVVDFHDAETEDRVAEIGRDLGIDLRLVSQQSRDERMYRATVDPARRDALLERLRALPDVEVAEPDALVHLIDTAAAPALEAPPFDPGWAGFPDDPQYKFQWHLGQIGMPGAWKLADGEGVIVAVIDTGVAYEDHKRFHRVPDLAGTRFTAGYDFVNDSPHANDDHGHGTHVAGTIAQSTHNGVGVAGVARHAVIMPLKVLSASGSGSVAGIADAIRFAADNGAQVINMSLGGRFRSKVLERAVAYAHGKGVTVVCAAGNDGSRRVSYPAAYPGAIAVAATQWDEATTFYSNYGKEIDVAAPGGNTQNDQNGDGMPDGVLQNTIAIGDPTKDGYFPFMGTSMASPHVAGVAALIVGEGVTQPAQVEKILEETARAPKGGKLDGLRYGAGIVDAPAAVRKARGETGAWQLGLGLLLAGLVAAGARVALRPGLVAGVVAGASGLFFFLPWLGDAGAAALALPGMDALTRGFPSWSLALLGPDGHGNALFFSVLAPLAFVALGYGVRRLRAPLAGFAIGVAAHLLFHAAAGLVDVRPVPNVLMLDQAWLAANALASLGLAALVLRPER